MTSGTRSARLLSHRLLRIAFISRTALRENQQNSLAAGDVAVSVGAIAPARDPLIGQRTGWLATVLNP